MGDGISWSSTRVPGSAGSACVTTRITTYEIEVGGGPDRRSRRDHRRSRAGPWSVPFDGGATVDLRLAAAAAPSGAAGVRARARSDVFHLAATIDGERVELAEIDGRFLSSEMTESFTGRVIGVYAVERRCIVPVDWFAYEGDDE